MTEADSKRVFGSGVFDRPQLAPTAHIDSKRQGRAAYKPLLRTGAVPDSIGRTFIRPAEESESGSNNSAAGCREPGIRTIRAGRFLSNSAGVTPAARDIAGVRVAGQALRGEIATPAPLKENAHMAKQTIGPAEDEERIKRIVGGALKMDRDPNMMPSYVEEFQRWRNAPVDQKDKIARDQFVNRTISDLWPDLRGKTEAELAAIIAPNGKRFRDCTQEDLDEMIAWLRNLRKAYRMLAAAVVLD
jgi:hypothetical protein